jgi:hypothetical protein
MSRSGFKNRFVGRLTRSLPLSHPDGLPVCVARISAAPLCEANRLLGRRLAQTPYNWTEKILKPLVARTDELQAASHR